MLFETTAKITCYDHQIFLILTKRTDPKINSSAIFEAEEVNIGLKKLAKNSNLQAWLVIDLYSQTPILKLSKLRKSLYKKDKVLFETTKVS